MREVTGVEAEDPVLEEGCETDEVLWEVGGVVLDKVCETADPFREEGGVVEVLEL